MRYFPLFYGICMLGLLTHIARQDVRRLVIEPTCLFVLLAGALLRSLAYPRDAWPSFFCALALTSLLIAGILFKTTHPPFILGGGDLKLLFALLLQLPLSRIPVFLGVCCLYMLLTHLVWPDKRRLPLAPALCGAWLCVMLPRI